MQPCLIASWVGYRLVSLLEAKQKALFLMAAAICANGNGVVGSLKFSLDHASLGWFKGDS
jgi:hypothetical protein